MWGTGTLIWGQSRDFKCPAQVRVLKEVSEESSQKQPNWEEKGLENHSIGGDSLRVLFGAAALFKKGSQ